MQSQPEQYPAVDFAKFMLAFVIIGIHTTVFAQFKWLDMGFDVFSRIAVPFFFAASGFFFFKKPVTRPNCARFAKRILILYLIYSVIFLTISSCMQSGFDSDIVFRTLISGYRHLWFLHALLIGMMLAACLIHFIKKTWIVYLIAALFLIFRYFMTTMWPLLASVNALIPIHDFCGDHLVLGFWNALFYAFPFIAVGHKLATARHQLSRIGCIAAILGAFTLLGAETYISSAILHTDSRILYLACVPLVYFSFQLCQQIAWPGNSGVSLFFRKTSTMIYCIHPAFILLMMDRISQGLVMFAIVSLCAFAFAIFVYWGTHYRWGRWMRYLL